MPSHAYDRDSYDFPVDEHICGFVVVDGFENLLCSEQCSLSSSVYHAVCYMVYLMVQLMTLIAKVET